MNKTNKLKRLVATTFLLFMTTLGLQGCGLELIVGTAVVGGYATVDRRTLGAQAEDKTITVKAETRAAELIGNSGHVNVTSYNRKVLLTGEVRDQQMKEQVERRIAMIENVQSIVNELEVGLISGIGSRSNDSYITGKIIASIIDAKDVFGNSLKVVTERGNVYLMGRVTYREGERAAQIASGVSGVVKVVKVFEYISEEELKRLSGSPPKEQSSSTDMQRPAVVETGAPAEVTSTPVR
jgi:osmotically-inducible protein OsmY